MAAWSKNTQKKMQSAIVTAPPSRTCSPPDPLAASHAPPPPPTHPYDSDAGGGESSSPPAAPPPPPSDALASRALMKSRYACCSGVTGGGSALCFSIASQTSGLSRTSRATDIHASVSFLGSRPNASVGESGSNLKRKPVGGGEAADWRRKGGRHGRQQAAGVARERGRGAKKPAPAAAAMSAFCSQRACRQLIQEKKRWESSAWKGAFACRKAREMPGARPCLEHCGGEGMELV